MESTIARISTAIQALLAVLLLAAVLLNCANIFARYFFNVSYLAGDELQVFAMVAIAFLGTISISAERQHLRMDVFVQLASRRTKYVIAILEAIATLVMGGFMTWYSFSFVQRIIAIGQRSGMADLPMWLPHGTVTLCFAAVTLLALIRLPTLLTRKDDAT